MKNFELQYGTDGLVAGVLAGGLSRRLGIDKALIRWNGKTLLEHSLDSASGLSEDVYVLTKNRSAYERFGYPVLTDVLSTATPLSGIITIIPFVDEWLLLTACDIVILAEDLLPAMWDCRSPGKAVVVRSQEGLQPFLGLYPAGLLPLWEQAYRNGNFKLQTILAGMPKVILETGQLEKDFGLAPVFANINRMTDIKILQGMRVMCE